MKIGYLLFALLLLSGPSRATDFKSNPCRPMLQKGIGVGNNNSQGEDCVSVRKEGRLIIHNTRNYLSTGEATVVENRTPEQDTSVPVDYTNSETENAYDYGEDD